MKSKDPAARILDAIEPLIREADHHGIALIGMDTISDIDQKDVRAIERLRETLAQICSMLDGYRTALGEDPIFPDERDLEV